MEYVQVQNASERAVGYPETVASSLAGSEFATNHFNFDVTYVRTRTIRGSNLMKSITKDFFHYYVHIIRNLMILRNTKRATAIAFGRNIFVALWCVANCLYRTRL